MEEQIGDLPRFSPIIVYVLSFLRHHPLLSVSFIIGIFAWLRYAKAGWRTPDPHIWGGGGILLGCIVSSFFEAVYCEQYLTPILLCMALFVPFAYSEMVAGPKTIRLVRHLYVIIAFCILAVRLDGVADEFKLTPYNARGNTPTTNKIIGEVTMAPTGLNILNEYDDILGIIPRNETVVAPWPFHPLFRRDLTFQIFDDRPSLAGAFKENDPMKRTFAPETFNNALERNPPGLIVLQDMDGFYPPGWHQVATDFLMRHEDIYEKYATKLYQGYIRKDLLD
ncbi:hypothetical protein [Geobacter sp. OR-1]|uniref:hypothetical protein n=1 Tax=Geobacter sp. OR-1 TaxID=1266765 RepID=UPI0012698B78|nr:hypothetical protein [Geobacter sp. OR-1]